MTSRLPDHTHWHWLVYYLQLKVQGDKISYTFIIAAFCSVPHSKSVSDFNKCQREAVTLNKLRIVSCKKIYH